MASLQCAGLLRRACHCMTPAAQAETLLMTELEARIIASTSAQAAPEEAGLAAESCAGAFAQEARCVDASHRVTLRPDLVLAARNHLLRRLMQAPCYHVSVRRGRLQGKQHILTQARQLRCATRSRRLRSLLE